MRCTVTCEGLTVFMFEITGFVFLIFLGKTLPLIHMETSFFVLCNFLGKLYQLARVYNNTPRRVPKSAFVRTITGRPVFVNPKCWYQAKKIPDVQDFFGYISCKNAPAFGHHSIYGHFTRVFFCVFYHVKKLVQNTLFWRGFFGTFLQKKITGLMPKSLNSMILGSVR